MIGANYAAWDLVMESRDGANLTVEAEGKFISECLLYLISNEFADRMSDKEYVLTQKGLERAEKLENHMARLRRGVPLRKREPLPMWFVLRRGNQTVRWTRGRIKRRPFLTDMGILVAGPSLTYDDKLKSFGDDLYLHYFPSTNTINAAAAELIKKVYSKRSTPTAPILYQRTSLSHPGAVWFKDIENNLLPMSAAYYDFLLLWSDRVRFDHTFGVVDSMFTVQCDNATNRNRLVGNLVAIVGPLKMEEPCKDVLTESAPTIHT